MKRTYIECTKHFATLDEIGFSFLQKYKTHNKTAMIYSRNGAICIVRPQTEEEKIMGVKDRRTREMYEEYDLPTIEIDDDETLIPLFNAGLLYLNRRLNRENNNG